MLQLLYVYEFLKWLELKNDNFQNKMNFCMIMHMYVSQTAFLSFRLVNLG